MAYSAKVLADSISPQGIRLTTLWIEFPRFILAEFNTHRMLSRNSNSSRAIPPERLIEQVETDPFVPVFGYRVKGMGVGNPLEGRDRSIARAHWVTAAVDAAHHARNLLDLGVDKSRINRLLEPFLWHRAVVTATEGDNFFALRDHESAQPEMRLLAQAMRRAMAGSIPVNLAPDEWHLPGLTTGETVASEDDIHFWLLVSAGRLARMTSYDRLDEDPPDQAAKRGQSLINSFHMSPLEHQARPFTDNEWSPYRQLLDERLAFIGNFRGWVQFRKTIPNEHNAALGTPI